MMIEPDEVIRALREGSRWANTAMVTVVSPVLLGYAASVAHDLSSTDHEIAVERAIRRGVAQIDRFDRSRGTFPAWLRPFVRNEINEMRRQRGSMMEPLRDDAQEAEQPPPPSPEKELAVAALKSALESLSDTDQLIILLRDYEQLDYDSCADRIGGVSAAACRVRHHRAVRRLAAAAQEIPELVDHFKEVGE